MKPLEDARARELLAALPDPRGLSPSAFARIRARLDAEPARRFRALHVVFAALLLATSGFAGTALFERARQAASPAPLGASAPVLVRTVPPAPTVSAAPTAPVRAEPAHPLASDAPAPAAAARSSEGPGPLARESKLLAEAVTALRKERNPARALALLDEYRASFPQGTLAGEATVTRIEALLALGRSADALELLERAPLGRLPRTLELFTLRGELRGARGRCTEAIADFDHVLAAGASAALSERALYGRAACHARTGDLGAARHDYEAYLARYPNGRFSSQASAALGSSR